MLILINEGNEIKIVTIEMIFIFVHFEFVRTNDRIFIFFFFLMNFANEF